MISPRERRTAAAVVCLALLVHPLWAAEPQVEELKIEILTGNGARNVAGRMPPGPLSVRVIDQNNRPVPDVSVVFSAPDSGPSGMFSSGSQVLMTTTDQNGRAAARFEPNSTPGNYNVQVLARQVLITAVAEIRQTNVPATAQAGSSKKTKMILAIAGGAAGVGILLGVSGGGGSSPSSPTNPNVPTISFGTATVGAPR
jgi:hypothetical protein